MARPASVALLALLLLGTPLAPGVAPAARAQDPVSTPFDPLPAEVLAVAAGWLAEANATFAAEEAARPGGNGSLAMRFFRDGAWDFLNESRLALALSQLFQVEVEARYQGFLATAPAEAPARRAALLALVDRDDQRSHQDAAALQERLAHDAASWRTTHAVEHALLACTVALAGEGFARSGAAVRARVANASSVDLPLERLAVASFAAPQPFGAWAHDLLDLAARAGADAGLPAVPAGAPEALREAARARLGDTNASSLPGFATASPVALQGLRRDLASGPAILAAARFLDFQQARAIDAINFLVGQGTLTPAGLQARLQALVGNATLEPTYDAQVLESRGPGALGRARQAGYQGVLQVDAQNHAVYRLEWDPSLDGLVAGWAHLLAARDASLLLAAAPAGDGRGADPSLLVFGGIAAAVAVAAIAFALLRRPGT